MLLKVTRSQFAHSRRDFLSMLGGSAAAIASGAFPAESAAGPLIDRDKTYVGMEDSASWRRDALQRIDVKRKYDFSVQLVDGAGCGIGNTEIEARLYRHKFGFGGGLRLERLFNEKHSRESRERYKELSAQLFHKVVSLNALKWKHIERNEPYIDPFFEWSATNEIPVRGHTLVWPDFQRAPTRIAQYASDPDGLRGAIRAHIERTLKRCHGRVVEWDVLNEPFTQHTYMDLLGEHAAAEWFEQVKELAPDAKRYINDFGVLTRSSEAQLEHYFAYVRWLLEVGAPVEGIGFQAHNPARFRLTAPETVLQTLDTFSTLGLEQQITEFDVESADEDYQARYTEDFMIAVFSHPSTVGLMTWTPFEYGDRVVSKPDAAFFDKKLRPKPNARVWDDLVNKQWTTRITVDTDTDGRIVFRGFAGKYKLRQAGSRNEYSIKLDSTNRVAQVTAV